MDPPIVANNHSAMLLPITYVNGDVKFLFERKSPGYMAPYFDNGLNLMGGNVQLGDPSTQHRLNVELAEEFHAVHEKEGETLEALLGAQPETLQVSTSAQGQYPPLTRTQQAVVREIYSILSEGQVYAGTALWRYDLPKFQPGGMLITGTTYVRVLNTKETQDIKKILGEFSGRVTTDNRKFGGATEFVPYEHLLGEKFAWGNEHAINDIFFANPHIDGYLPTLPAPILAGAAPMVFQPLRELDLVTNPTKDDFARIGITFNPKNW